MKLYRTLAALFVGAAMISASVASAQGEKTQAAVQLAVQKGSSIESIATAASDAVKNGESPSEVMAGVLGARETWTNAQVAFLYKTVLMSSPEMSATFAQDLDAFLEAGKPAQVAADASEGLKVLAVLVASGKADTEVVLASIIADHNGPSGVMSVSALRDVRAGTARRQHPVMPTPPATSADN